MVYLECDILGNHKKIEIESIEYGNDDKVIKYDDTHYYYNVDKKHQKSFKILLKILNLWNDLVKKFGIQYWACAGTLLGAVRHGGFIFWDNDVDISILLSDFKKVKHILENHPVLSCCVCEYGFQVRYRDYEFPFMDIFVCDYYDKNTIKYCGFLTNDGKPTWFTDYFFPNEHIYHNELFPLKKIAFENTTIMAPNIQKNVLFRAYSKNCLTACKIANHTDVHETASKKMMELRYHTMKKIYHIETALKVPRNIMFNTLQYKLTKKIQKKMNNNNQNSVFNKVILTSVNKLDDLINVIT